MTIARPGCAAPQPGHFFGRDGAEKTEESPSVYASTMLDDYAQFHQDRGNMLIHIVAVPAFIYGTWLALSGVFSGRWLGALFGLAAIGVSLALQNVGHKREGNPPRPFEGGRDFFQRIFSEQFFKFPAYVVNGGWFRVVFGKAA